MIDDNKVKRDATAADDEFLERLTHLLHAYDYDTPNTLARFVAALCDVDVADMLSAVDKSHFSQARWLFWYAYRYMTKETTQRIAERTTFNGHTFGASGIAAGITRMSILIERDGIWRKRWAITKRFINAHNAADSDFANRVIDTPIKITLSAPKGTNIELKET